MFKKVLCLLLVIVCSVAFFACGTNGDNTDGPNNDPTGGVTGDTPPGDEEEDGSGSEEDVSGSLGEDATVDYALEQMFFSAVNSSEYNIITTKTETSNSMFADVAPCTGFYQTTILDGDNYSFYYWYETYNRIGEGNGELKTKTDPHTILYMDGEYFYDGNKVYANPDPAVLNVKLNLDTEYLGAYTISKDGTKLTAKVSAANINSVLGVAVSATGDVNLTVEINGSSLYMITVEYVSGEDRVRIETSYTYLVDAQ